MNKQIKDFLKASSVVAGITIYGLSQGFAQVPELDLEVNLERSKGGGGGSGEEIIYLSESKTIVENLDKIKRFFDKNPQLAEEFPEVDITALMQMIEDMRVEVVNGDLVDKHGVLRTAVNFPSELLVRYSTKRLQMIEDQPKVLFVLNFHELLGLMGIEESHPENEFLIESYSISSRLIKYIKRVANYDLIYQSQAVLPPYPEAAVKSLAEMRCLESYQAKLGRIDNKRKLRKTANDLGRVTGAVLGFAVGGVTLGWGGAAVGFVGPMTLIPSLNRESGIQSARLVLFESAFTYEELDSYHYHNLVEEKSREHAAGFKTKEEVLDYVTTRWPFEQYKNGPSHVGTLLNDVNEQRLKKGKAQFNIAELKQLIAQLDSAGEFCPVRRGKQRPITIKKMKKILVRY